MIVRRLWTFRARRPIMEQTAVFCVEAMRIPAKGAIQLKIRNVLCALLAALLMMIPALAEEESDFSFDFDDGGYTGEWVDLPVLGIEFCQPDGWAHVEGLDGEGYAAATQDGSASLVIRVEANEVEDIVAWGDANLSGYDVDATGFFDTLVVEDQLALDIYRLINGDVIHFAFTRASDEALTRAFALEIVDSVNEAWMDEGTFDEGEDDADNPLAGD